MGLTKLVGILVCNDPPNTPFDPLKSDIWFLADGDTYELKASPELRQQIGDGKLVNFSWQERIHVKAAGEALQRADNIALFTAIAIERIDL